MLEAQAAALKSANEAAIAAKETEAAQATTLEAQAAALTSANEAATAQALVQQKTLETLEALQEAETSRLAEEQAKSDAAAAAAEAETQKADTAKKTRNTAGAASGGAILSILLAVAAFRYRLKQMSLRAHDFDATLAAMKERGEIAQAQLDKAKQNNAVDNTQTASHCPREIKRSNITMISKIGAGAFGDVWKAILDESRTNGGVPGYEVAVKTCNVAGGDGEEDLVKEATVMAMVPFHEHIVPLIGVVTRGVPLYLIVPICSHGSMLSFVQKRANESTGNQRLTVADKVAMATDVAKGMAHLKSCSFVHRDLAARNVLINSVFVARVADFGLSRATAATTSSNSPEDGAEEQYYRSARGQFPVRWTAPEAMETNKFTTQTDVWSFGVTVAEIFNDGARPFASLENLAVITNVMAGRHDKRPETCPDDVWTNVLERCWNHDPKKRPSFEELVAELESCASANGVTTLQAGIVPSQQGGSSNNVDATAASPYKDSDAGGGGGENAVTQYTPAGAAQYKSAASSLTAAAQYAGSGGASQYQGGVGGGALSTAAQYAPSTAAGVNTSVQEYVAQGTVAEQAERQRQQHEYAAAPASEYVAQGTVAEQAERQRQQHEYAAAPASEYVAQGTVAEQAERQRQQHEYAAAPTLAWSARPAVVETSFASMVNSSNTNSAATPVAESGDEFEC